MVFLVKCRLSEIKWPLSAGTSETMCGSRARWLAFRATHCLEYHPPFPYKYACAEVYLPVISMEAFGEFPESKNLIVGYSEYSETLFSRIRAEAAGE